MTSFRQTLLALLVPLFAAGNAADNEFSNVTWEPLRPTEGSIVTLMVQPSSRFDHATITVSSTIANQALHFEADTNGAYSALAPIPVGSGDTLAIPIRISDASGFRENKIVKVPVSAVSSGVLQLSVDPRFITPPDSELPRIQRERSLVASVSRASHETPRLWSGTFLRPRSTRITSDFGQRREFNGEFRSLHMGVDLSGSTGAPVIASNRGVVVIVHDFYYAGNAIHIDHGLGLTTAYMHLSEINVAVGDTVQRGDVIGKVGATGRVTGPHLHWHAKYGLVTFNPLSLLDVEVPAFAPHQDR